MRCSIPPRTYWARGLCRARDRARSAECARELLLVFSPPPASTIESCHAPHVVPHCGEVRVSGFDPPADELAAPRHGVGDDVDELHTRRGVEAVCVRHEPEPCGTVGGMP